MTNTDITFEKTAYEIIKYFVGKSLDNQLLKKIINRSYKSFRNNEVTTLKQLDKNNYILGNIFISPCFGISDFRLLLGRYTWSKFLFRLFLGKERKIGNRNPEEKKWWCTTYPVEAILNLEICIEKIWKADFSKITSPGIFIYSPR